MRYDENEEEWSKMEVKSDCGDGEEVKCIIPANKTRAYSFLPKNANHAKQKNSSVKTKIFERSNRTSYAAGKEEAPALFTYNQIQEQNKLNKLYFEEPERN